MDHSKEKINLNEDITNTDDSNFKSLYGLTPAVENTILNAINKKNSQSLKKLIEPLHPADQADMLERLSDEQISDFLSLLGKSLDPEVLVYLDLTYKKKLLILLALKL